ncbi:hypothetical protein [Shinella sp.]|uniref:hypothetical protein n=1 Tax=Shinella sp. TaxID=1870904 RepID=UPI0028A60FEE|nr:hypothetical protein [Shinella sp.]
MADFATLVLAADSSGLVAGEQALNRLASTAERTENTAGRSLASVGKAAEQVGKQSAFANQSSRMMAMQLSQVAQQASVTGNWLQALAIQIPDLALGFGPIGIAAGAAAGATLAYFASYEGGDGANKILEEQVELIRRVADLWGDAVPALQEYIAQIERAREVTDLIAAADVAAASKWQVAREDVSELGDELAVLLVDLQQAGAEDETILKLRDAFTKVQEAVADGRDDVGAMKDVQDALADAVEQTGIPALANFATAFGSLAESISGAIRGAQVFKQEAIQALTLAGNELGTLSPLFSEDGRFFTGEDFTPRNPPTPDSRPLIELDGLPGEFGRKGRKGRKGGKTQAQLYDDIVDAANRRITSLEAEKNAIGLTDEAAAKLLYTTDLFNDAQQKGINLSGPQREQLTTLAETMARVEEETRQASEAMEFQKDVLHGIFGDLRDALDDGKITWEEFGDIAMGVLDKVIDKIQDDLVDAIVNSGTSGGGGFLSGLFGLFGDGGASADPWSGMRVASFDGGGYTGKRSRSGGMDGKGGFMALLHPDETVIDHTKSVGSSVPEREGRTVIEVRMSSDVESRIMQNTSRNTVEIVKQNNKNRQEAYVNGDNAYG